MSLSYIYFSLAVGVATGAWAAYVMEKKGHPRGMGFLLGFLLGMIGVLIAYLWKSKVQPPR
jgi:uncharacterized membrane protein YeaQ/YmgE (transglycosylase-associated protein family)